ncbi:MAG: PCRF domain-containing protein, partial [Bifidobacteriaceae bacterium]|nr:PCRF domain-containing protein [Bifidobacteriaceae bacterium]
MPEPFEAVRPLLAEHAHLEAQLADPALHTKPGRARMLGRRYATVGKIVRAYQTWLSADADAGAARELATSDPAFAEELPALEAARDQAAEILRELLIPRDPDAGRDVILEIKAGEGGEESALFAADLLRMYTRYAERRGWSVEILDLTGTELGGVKDATLGVKSRGDDDDGVWAHLKYEGGVHRVQRVP